MANKHRPICFNQTFMRPEASACLARHLIILWCLYVAVAVRPNARALTEKQACTAGSHEVGSVVLGPSQDAGLMLPAQVDI